MKRDTERFSWRQQSHVILLVGALWNGALFLLGLLTLRGQHATGRVGGPEDQDPTLAMGIEV